MICQLPSQPVKACLSYLRPTSTRPCNYTYEPPAGTPWESGEYESKEVNIRNGRAAAAAPSLEREGFELWDAPTCAANFLDDQSITTMYYPEASEIALAATGAAAAFVFDHLLRRHTEADAPLSFSKKALDGVPGANGRIHNDYTEASGARRLSLVLNDASALSRIERFSIVNIWRPIKRPVARMPLALCDATSIRPYDLVTSEVRYPDRTGEIYLATHASSHRWWYFPDMNPHEALVFKQFDSQCSGTSRFTPHSAFTHPDAPAGAPARESIELRCLVVY